MKEATFQQAQQVLKFIDQANITGKQLQRLLDSRLFTDFLEAAASDAFTKLYRDSVRIALGLPKLTPDPIIMELEELTIPANATIEEMLRAGEHDMSDHVDRICKHLTITRHGAKKLYLAYFKKDLDSAQVEGTFAQMYDKEPARIEDLLAVDCHPKSYKLLAKFSIFALGSSVELDGLRRVPCLRRGGGRHRLRLDYDGLGWHDDCAFLLTDSSAKDCGGQVGPPSPKASPFA